MVAIYEKWENVTASKAAIRLGVTKMSANRCFDEIEYLNVDILGMKGKSRVITVPADIQKLWNDVRVILRNPVIARYELKEDIQLEKRQESLHYVSTHYFRIMNIRLMQLPKKK